MRVLKYLKLAAGMLLIASVFALCFLIFAYPTSLFIKHSGINLSDSTVQMIFLLVGSLIGFICISITRLFTLKVLKINPVILTPEVFESVIAAIGRIGKGDFAAKLEDNPRIKAFSRQADDLVESVNKMGQELNRMEEMRQEFIANVSHEIQSPLTSIRGFSQILRNDKLGHEERLHYLNIIEEESFRLSKLSDNLLKLASLDSETIKFEPEPYRLDKQLRNLILACEPQWSGKAINMEIFLDEIEIKADKDLMSQVWVNLIHNSIKFTPEAGCIRLDLHSLRGKTVFMITDTGIGISEEDQDRIFERFFKADRSREYSNKGSGLGLAIARKIVDMHCGTISVRSEKGKGTTFTVSLPAEV